VAGFCNATIGSGSNDLKGPWGIYVPPSNGSLYVADYDGNKYQVFPPFSRTGQTFFSNGGIDPTDVFVDSSGTIYMTVGGNNPIVNIQQAGVIVRTVPSTQGTWSTSCYLYQLYSGYSAAVDGSGNIYVSLYYCGTVVKWAPNATSGTLVVTGLSTAVRFIVLGENRSALYVSDAGNNRIQKFIIGGNGTGITVAGGNGAGTNLNQLKSPAGIRVTSDGQTLYIADYGNNRIVKWTIGASQGEVVAGSASGTAGSTSQLLNQPAGLALDPSETYVYVADYNNYRVQRFRVQ
jgi:DNA-binding beta-propeller fold protein YncE